MKLKALLSAMLMGLATPAAMAATYTYTGPVVNIVDNGWVYNFLGAYNVADGPAYAPTTYRPSTGTYGPPVYSALDAAATVFGGQQSDYAVSIYSPFYDPTQTFFDPILGFDVPTAPPAFNPATGQIVPGQTVSTNAIISHTGWYDTYGGIPEPDPAILLRNVLPADVANVSSYAAPYVIYTAPPAPDAGVMYTTPSGTGTGPQVAGNLVSLFAKAEGRDPLDPRYLTDGTLLDVLPAGYSVPYPNSTVGANPSWSAYVRDNMWGPPEREFFTNYVWQKVAPIPEPETYVMMLAGLGLITLMARRRMNG